MVMRRYMNLIETLMNESVSFYPSTKHTAQGEDGPFEYYGPPRELVYRKEMPCEYCDGTGKEEIDGKQYNCMYCEGRGTNMETVWDLPHFNVANANARIILNMLNLDFDDDDALIGHVNPEQIPEMKRRLIKLMNTDVSHYGRDETDTRERYVDRSGDIPRIRTGPRMIDFGVDENQLRKYIQMMMEVLDYAQTHRLGISWA